MDQNNLSTVQLKILGFPSNEVWHKNREMLGHKDGEDFETFFHRTHGYKSDRHLIEITKKNLTLEERMENRIMILEDTNKQFDVKFTKAIKSIHADHNTLVKSLEERFKVIQEKVTTLIDSLNKLEKCVGTMEKVLSENFKLTATPKLLNALK